MIAQHTWPAILNGTKTETSRIVRGDEDYSDLRQAVCGTGRDEQTGTPYDIVRYQVGKVYSIQPGRGQKTVHWRRIAGLLQSTYDADCPASVRAAPSAHDAWQPLRIRILSIYREDIRQAGAARATAEGFANVIEFWQVWCKMHDPTLMYWYADPIQAWCVGEKKEWKHGSSKVVTSDTAQDIQSFLLTRPQAHYDAWVLKFEVVQ